MQKPALILLLGLLVVSTVSIDVSDRDKHSLSWHRLQKHGKTEGKLHGQELKLYVASLGENSKVRKAEKAALDELRQRLHNKKANRSTSNFEMGLNEENVPIDFGRSTADSEEKELGELTLL